MFIDMLGAILIRISSSSTCLILFMPAATPYLWLKQLRRLPPQQPAVLVSITASKGSVPRHPGTRMLVTADSLYDTIGGGHLEWKAIAQARLWLAETPDPFAWERQTELALGPSLGQCCGGIVQLMLERVDAWSSAVREQRLAQYQQENVHVPHLYLFGAGHVGSALVHVLQQTPCRITWVDERDHLFPANLPDHVTTEATDTPEAVIASADHGSYFLVMTHHHGLDLHLCEQILRKENAAWFGLIGSQTKRARFEHRLRDKGYHQRQLDRMHCPIGLPGVTGKEPGVIAVAVAAQLLLLWSETSCQAAPPFFDKNDTVKITS